MHIRLLQFWQNLRASYWFIPSLMILAAMSMAALTLEWDHNLPLDAILHSPYIWRGGAESARSLLEIIAGSMITVATLAFSITIVSYSQASAQFGPRLLRNFVRDTNNQIVLGTLTATFVYCLLILRAVRSGIDAGLGQVSIQSFVPYISVSVGFGLGLASLGVLIYFIHHVSQTIYAPNVIGAVADDLMDAIERLFPWDEEPIADSATTDTPLLPPENLDAESIPLIINKSGYLQAIDYGNLLSVIESYNLKIAINPRPGQFVFRGDVIGRLWPTGLVNDHVLQQLSPAFVVGHQRVAPQDVEYSIDQLVEIALRALSLAINDPFTAINCIDWLGVALSRLVEKKIPPAYLRDSSGHLRLYLTHPITFAGLSDTAFNQIRQQAGNQVAVLIRLLEVLAVIARHTDDENELQVLFHHATMIKHCAHKALNEIYDLNEIDDRFNYLVELVETQSKHHRPEENDRS